MVKPRSWTFPAYPSRADGVAPVSVAGCQPSFLASVGLTFLCMAGEEAAFRREEDSDAEGEHTVQGEEVGAAVSVGQCCVLDVQYSVSEVQYSKRGRLP